MTYYWIVSQLSGKVLEVEDGSVDNNARIIQYTKKSEDDPNVDMQLWSFDGGFIINKKSGLVLDLTEGKVEDYTQIIQYQKDSEPAVNQEWDYNREDKTINLRANRKFALDVKHWDRNDAVPIILYGKHGDQNQQFILQKWNNNTTTSNFGRLVTNIIDYNKFLPKLSQNLLEILDDDEYYDTTIEVGNDPYVETFRAHMVILSYRSPYLRRMLSTNKKKNDGTLSHIKLPNILPKTFHIILRYIYGGRISLEELDTSDIVKILVSAGELSLQELITFIQSFLIENKANWMEQNFDLIYKTSFENDSFLELQKYCTNLISNEPDKIFKSPKFSSIPEKLLVSLIQNDNLRLSEIQVWEHVLRWGLAQNPGLSSDPTSFSKEDFKTLKNTLQQCIPFIRFYNLTSKEFLNKVFSYRKIIPKELYIDLLKDFLDNDSKPSDKSKPRMTKEIREINSKNIDSKIITFKHAELISKWVITEELASPYEFKLLFRGSRDGFYPEKFHEICDNQSRTVTIVKVKGSNEILGGYNPIQWKSDAIWSVTKDSFIFSFKNNDRTEDHVLSRVVHECNAINNGTYCGPSFGDGDLIIWGFDFFTLDNYCRSNKASYEKSIRETEDRFSIEEWEVFRLMSKLND